MLLLESYLTHLTYPSGHVTFMGCVCVTVNIDIPAHASSYNSNHCLKSCAQRQISTFI